MQQICKERMQSYIAMVDEAMERYLAPKSETYRIVLDAMLYSASAGGKRIRPVLVLEFCRICGGDVKLALPFASAIEMIHTSSLIHDDLPCMDDDDLRRGRPSCHKQFDEATALLAGDALLIEAFDVMSDDAVLDSGLDAKRALRAANRLAAFSGKHGMVGGQVIDLGMEDGSIPFTTERLFETDRLKTGALIKAACTMGVILGGGDEIKVKAAEDFAAHLGQAFQIVDDILDVIGDESKLGKPIGSDSVNDKKTYTSVFGLEGAKEKAKEHTALALQALDTFEDTTFLRELTESLLQRDH